MKMAGSENTPPALCPHIMRKSHVVARLAHIGARIGVWAHGLSLGELGLGPIVTRYTCAGRHQSVPNSFEKVGRDRPQESGFEPAMSCHSLLSTTGSCSA